MLARLDEALRGDEPRVDMIRDAIDREIENRRLEIPAAQDANETAEAPSSLSSEKEGGSQEIKVMRDFPMTVEEAAEIHRRLSVIEEELARIRRIVDLAPGQPETG